MDAFVDCGGGCNPNKGFNVYKLKIVWKVQAVWAVIGIGGMPGCSYFFFKWINFPIELSPSIFVKGLSNCDMASRV